MTSNNSMTRADFGVFGGSGFTHLLDDAETCRVDTPWGLPSAPITIGTVGDHRVAFLARHGSNHEYPPHRVNYRANVDAMHQLGVRTVLGPFAAGSLRPEIKPGDVVVVDQFVDRTSGRAETFHDHFHNGPRHLTLPDPYDSELRRLLVEEAPGVGVTVHDGGTVVVINGPRFSTRAESRWLRRQGWHVVNMTQHPEAALVAEAGLAYAALAIVTDHDAGVEDDPSVHPVTQEEVFKVFDQSIAKVRNLILAVITRAD
jgi:5'-methylthioadenosine phosphorylase